MLEKEKLMVKMAGALEKAQELMDEEITLQDIKECDDGIISYDLFYYFTHSSHVKEYELVGETMADEVFAYVIAMTLEDDTKIQFAVDTASFEHSFLSEEVIIVDTEKTMDRLKDVLDEGCDAVQIMIQAPECIDPEREEYLSRRLAFYGINENEDELYEFDPVEEIEIDD